MLEQEDRNCLARLPSRKTALVVLIGIAVTVTLTLVHLSGQWVGQRVFKPVHEPSLAHRSKQLLSQKVLREPAKISWKDRQDEDLKSRNKEGTDEPSSHQLKGGFAKEERTSGSMDSSKRPLPSLNSIIGERPGQNLSAVNNVGLLSVPSRGQTEHSFPPPTRKRVDQITALLDPKIGQSVVPTEKLLQGTIRRERVPAATEKLSGEMKWSRRNVYDFNDRDRNAFRGLRLRNKNDRVWKSKEAIIFNRVGKCGSRTIIGILRKLSDLNNFNLVSSTVYNSTAISTEWQSYIVKVMERVKTPYLFQRHLHFVDFTEFNARQPMYINVIRDPLSRFVSNYYFKRFGDGRSNQNFKGSKEAKYRSVTECIIKGYKECVRSGSFYIIPFFCGQRKECRRPSQWALDEAKLNVEKHFVVVGILEDLESSFRVLEKALPQFFTGAVKLLLEPDDKQALKNASTTTKYKEKPSKEAAAIMKKLMYYEYEFYKFVKDRLERQKQQYGIGMAE
ncbi:uronyl 2-sulfotransferase-like [Acanthaster planci]|uniref:Uronyl 2-sulfotransferase-like n=1 Tax=Acanthaster planci TaxID=133434 RepID=A0A8B7YNI1_ACAPL|nr:uronyl 2-sulfotransferase-like [Acanthaster planci]XP_022094825.1 uronyl 2-sulfotransferase-like [Acanthaster planci]